MYLHCPLLGFYTHFCSYYESISTIYFFPAESGGVVEGELGNPVGLDGGDDFQTLHDPRHGFVLNRRVFPLGLLPVQGRE
jgi:hypothetical protein